MLIMAALFNGLSGNSVLTRVNTLVSLQFSKPSVPARERARPRPKVTKAHRAAPARAAGRPARAADSVLPFVALATTPNPANAASGAGEIGSGSGAGEMGDGAGGGGGKGGSDVELIGGHIDDRDYPAGASNRGAQGTVRTEIAVGVDGRATGCRITGKSGDADLDDATCRLILKRFRFRPATDASGRTIPDSVDYDQEWILRRAMDEPGTRGVTPAPPHSAGNGF